MSRVLRGQKRDMLAVVVLFFAGIATMLVIIGQQKASLPGWVPLFGQDFFQLEAEFLPAQAVTPGQGQAVQIAGIQVGKVGNVELQDGRALVRMDIEPEYAPLIHRNATLLLRPKTGLADMTIEMDPGRAGPLMREGETVPLSNTQPNINADEILATLDVDTRNYLTLLLDGAAKGIGGEEKGLQASAGLRRLLPLTRDLARINTAVAKRRGNLARVIHNFGQLMEELGRHDQQLAQFVDSSNAVFDSFASQQEAIRLSLRGLPPTLRETETAMRSGDRLALELRRGLPRLIPAAATLRPGLESLQRLFTDTTPPIRDQIRPFTRQVRTPVRHLSQGGAPLKKGVEGLKVGLGNLNYGLNELAYNPDPNVGNYLFYLGWLNHNLNAVYLNQDAYGPLRRGVIMASCATATFAFGIARANPFLRTLQQLTRFPNEQEACS